MSQVRIGILSVAHLHAGAYARIMAASPDIEFAGIAEETAPPSSADAGAGPRLAQTYGVPFYSSTQALLDKGLDGVIVASENVRHRSLVEQAAASGARAILCEKPLATTQEDAEAMIAHCASRGVALATAFPSRFSPAFADALALVKSGGIGEILAIRGKNRGRNPGGWFTDRSLAGGGAVMDHTVHVADLNRVLLGREAVEVYAEIGNGFAHGDYDDTGMLTITYESGAFATLDTSWSRPKTYPTWGDIALQIVGSGGVIEFDLFAQALAHYDDQAHVVTWTGWGSNIDSLMIAEFVRLIRGEPARALATGEDGLRALDVALGAYRSAELGQPVALRA